jgi:hypothetical protein
MLSIVSFLWPVGGILDQENIQLNAESGSTSIRSPFRSQWPLAPAVIEYVALSLGISQHEACFVLQQRLLDRSIRARGPIKSASAIEIDSEFWRFALPTPEGEARNLSTFVPLPWFEVCAKDILAIWPMK